MTSAPSPRLLPLLDMTDVVREPEALKKAAQLGAPSWVWRAGQQRRLDLLPRWVPLEGRRILDIGCGVGMYLRAFLQYSDSVAGLEIDRHRAIQARSVAPVFQGRGESLPFRDGAFDIVFLNEVLEHVDDDHHTLTEAARILARGGHVAIFVPNRLYPFETHGIYWRGRYHFGNFPLVNYLPNALRNRLVPHARAYAWADLQRTFDGLPFHVVHHGYVYPGFDNIKARFPMIGDILRKVLYALERTPLQVFGLSHFLVLQRL